MNAYGLHVYDGFDPLPEDVTGWGGDAPIFAEMVERVRPSVTVELGSWKGQSTRSLGTAIRETTGGVLYAVDTWLGAEEFVLAFRDDPGRDLCQHHGYPGIYYQFLSNMIHAGLQGTVIPVPNTTRIARRYLEGTVADLVYVDASHLYEDVASDMADYWTLLRPGGVMFGDDYGIFDGVTRAYHEFSHGTKSVDGRFWVIGKDDEG